MTTYVRHPSVVCRPFVLSSYTTPTMVTTSSIRVTRGRTTRQRRCPRPIASPAHWPPFGRRSCPAGSLLVCICILTSFIMRPNKTYEPVGDVVGTVSVDLPSFDHMYSSTPRHSGTVDPRAVSGFAGKLLVLLRCCSCSLCPC